MNVSIKGFGINREKAVKTGNTRSDGFTLIELLVVVIIIAILAAIAIPTFLGARGSAHNAAAYTLVRNALTMVESANIDHRDYQNITVAELRAIEPSITWNFVDVDLVDPTGPSISAAVTAQASLNQVDFHAHGADRFDLASTSANGDTYGIEVATTGNAQASYIKVKEIGGAASMGW